MKLEALIMMLSSLFDQKQIISLRNYKLKDKEMEFKFHMVHQYKVLYQLIHLLIHFKEMSFGLIIVSSFHQTIYFTFTLFNLNLSFEDVMNRSAASSQIQMKNVVLTDLHASLWSKKVMFLSQMFWLQI